MNASPKEKIINLRDVRNVFHLKLGEKMGLYSEKNLISVKNQKRTF